MSHTITSEEYEYLDRIIRRDVKRFPRYREDLYQEGWVGVMQAARSFNPSRRVQFVTFAYKHARGSMYHFIRDKIFGRTKGRRILLHPQYLQQKTSFEFEFSEDLSTSVGTVDENFDRADTRLDLLQALTRFSSLEKRILLLMAMGFIQKEVARQVHLSQRQVCRILHRHRLGTETSFRGYKGPRGVYAQVS